MIDGPNEQDDPAMDAEPEMDAEPSCLFSDFLPKGPAATLEFIGDEVVDCKLPTDEVVRTMAGQVVDILIRSGRLTLSRGMRYRLRISVDEEPRDTTYRGTPPDAERRASDP